MTKLLAQELGKSNPLIRLDLSDVEKLKEQYACCAEDDLAYDKTEQSCPEELHTLPDGQVYTPPPPPNSPLPFSLSLSHTRTHSYTRT